MLRVTLQTKKPQTPVALDLEYSSTLTETRDPLCTVQRDSSIKGFRGSATTTLQIQGSVFFRCRFPRSIQSALRVRDHFCTSMRLYQKRLDVLKSRTTGSLHCSSFIRLTRFKVRIL